MKNPDPSVLPVCAKRCTECLYSSARIVTDERADSVIAECERTGRVFLCHKASVRGEYVACRGFIDAHPDMPVVALANALGAVRNVPVT